MSKILVDRDLLERLALPNPDEKGWTTWDTSVAYPAAKELRALLQAPAQPAQVQGWQMPKPMAVDGMYGKDHMYSEGWNDALLEVVELNAAAPKPPVQEPVAWMDSTWTLYTAKLMASMNITTEGLTPLYAAPQPPVSDDLARDAARYRWLRDRGDACQWENILRFDLEEFVCADNALDAAMTGVGNE